MSNRRRARSRPVQAPSASEVPPELLAGACIEVWVEPDSPLQWRHRAHHAFRRFRQARSAWGLAHGLHRLDGRHLWPKMSPGINPWSFYFIQRERPDDLVARLASDGLPADWTPTFIETIDYGPSLIPDGMTAFEFRAWRAQHPLGE